MFRNHINLDNTKATFAAATLQGEEAPPDNQNHGQNLSRGQKYIENNGKHIINQCYLLNKHLRPKKWQIGPKRAKAIIKAL